MSAETRKSDEPVHGGVQNEADPIPKESLNPPGKGPASGDATWDPEASRDAESNGEDAGADDPTGPAEEQNDASPDDRGLATELGPSD